MTHDNSSHSAPAARSGTNGFAVAGPICGIIGPLNVVVLVIAAGSGGSSRHADG